MTYQLIVKPKARKNLNKLPIEVIVKIDQALIAIASDPFCGKKLSGKLKDQWSYRLWPYRIIYTIKKKELIVLVIDIGHRQGVYN